MVGEADRLPLQRRRSARPAHRHLAHRLHEAAHEGSVVAFEQAAVRRPPRPTRVVGCATLGRSRRLGPSARSPPVRRSWPSSDSTAPHRRRARGCRRHRARWAATRGLFVGLGRRRRHPSRRVPVRLRGGRGRRLASRGAADSAAPGGAADSTAPGGAADSTAPGGAADSAAPGGAADCRAARDSAPGGARTGLIRRCRRRRAGLEAVGRWGRAWPVRVITRASARSMPARAVALGAPTWPAGLDSSCQRHNSCSPQSPPRRRPWTEGRSAAGQEWAGSRSPPRCRREVPRQTVWMTPASWWVETAHVTRAASSSTVPTDWPIWVDCTDVPTRCADEPTSSAGVHPASNATTATSAPSAA